MKNWITEHAINFLFYLVGNYSRPTESTSVLFTGKRVLSSHRKKDWERGLSAVWQNKAFIDFLWYQAEMDKENAWKGRVAKQVAQGARVRALFIVYQAQKAHKVRHTKNQERPEDRDAKVADLAGFDKTYKQTVDIQ